MLWDKPGEPGSFGKVNQGSLRAAKKQCPEQTSEAQHAWTLPRHLGSLSLSELAQLVLLTDYRLTLTSQGALCYHPIYTRREEICLSIMGRMVTSSCALTLEPQNVNICADGTFKEVANRMLLGVTLLLSPFSRIAVPGFLQVSGPSGLRFLAT